MTPQEKTIYENAIYSLDKFDLRNNLLYFIHIPKTSGTALTSDQIIKLGHNFNVPNVTRWSAESRGFHEYSSKWWDVYTYPFSQHYKITIIRNPFDLLFSYYSHDEPLNPDGSYCHSGWAAVNYSHQFKTFKQFIHAYCDPSFHWHVPAFKCFLYSQLFDETHKCVADIIIKYEHLDIAIRALNTKMAHPIEEKNIDNVSLRKGTSTYRDHYDDEMIELVTKKCQRELHYFGYTFHGSDSTGIIVNPKIKYDVYGDKLHW